jgi:hypothetical protein
MLYAIGEIILVVIGILIALQINNWNERKKEIALEHGYYCRILEDFELNARLITATLAEDDEKIENTRNLLISLHKGDKDKYTLLNSYLMSLRMQVFVPRKLAFNDLTSSGNLKLVSDPSMKKSLILYYGELENIEKQLEQNRDELVRRSFNYGSVTEFGLQELAYLKTSLGEEIIGLLPDVDWTRDKEHPYFLKFQDDLVFLIAMYERHKQHLTRMDEEMQKTNALLKVKCGT